MSDHLVLWSHHAPERQCGTHGQHIVGHCSCGSWIEAKSADDIPEAILAHHPAAKWGKWPQFA